MIIALVFMLFCACIGGVVLAAATANGGRLKALTTDQAQLMRERSAAQFLFNQIQSDVGNRMRLDVSFVESGKRYYTRSDLSGIETFEDELRDVVATTEISCGAAPTGGFNLMQQLLLENTVLKFIQENDIPNPQEIKLKNFNFGGRVIDNPTQFLLYSTSESEDSTISLEITDPLGYKIPVTVSCPSKEEDYSFYVTLGEDVKFSLNMASNVSQIKEPYESDGKYVQTSALEGYQEHIEASSFSISWQDVQIVKGGAN